MSDKIEPHPLPPPHFRTTITAADRPAVYRKVRRELRDLLIGANSYYPDNSPKSPKTLLEDVSEFITQVDGLYPFVNDPSEIMPGVLDDLKKFRDAFARGLDAAEPVVHIKIPNEFAPYSLDKGVDIGVDLDPEPQYSPKPPRSPFRDIHPVNWQRAVSAVGGVWPSGSVAPFGAAPAVDRANHPLRSAGPIVGFADDGAVLPGVSMSRAGFRGLLAASTAAPANDDRPRGGGDYPGLRGFVFAPDSLGVDVGGPPPVWPPFRWTVAAR
jgi:hypothetical protein